MRGLKTPEKLKKKATWVFFSEIFLLVWLALGLIIACKYLGTPQKQMKKSKINDLFHCVTAEVTSILKTFEN